MSPFDFTGLRYALGNHQNWQKRVGWKDRYTKVTDDDLPYRLGGGSFGRVVHMKETGSDQHVAVKKVCFEDEFYTIPDMARSEFNAGKAIDSPYVVSPLAMALDPCKKRAYIVFPLVRGSSLATLDNNGRFTDCNVVRQVFADVLVGLQHCHDKGIAHGDLALRNIMVENGRGRLIDLGYLHCDPFETERFGDMRCVVALLAKCWPGNHSQLKGLQQAVRGEAFVQDDMCPMVLLAQPFFDGVRQKALATALR